MRVGLMMAGVAAFLVQPASAWVEDATVYIKGNSNPWSFSTKIDDASFFSTIGNTMQLVTQSDVLFVNRSASGNATIELNGQPQGGMECPELCRGWINLFPGVCSPGAQLSSCTVTFLAGYDEVPRANADWGHSFVLRTCAVVPPTGQNFTLAGHGDRHNLGEITRDGPYSDSRPFLWGHAMKQSLSTPDGWENVNLFYSLPDSTCDVS